MNSKYFVLISSLLLAILAIPSLSAIEVTVIGPDGKAVANITVKAVNGTTTITSNTTDSAGVAVLSVPKGVMLIVAEYNATVDAIIKVSVVYGNETYTLNMSSLHYVAVYSEPVKVSVTVVENTTGTKFTYTANETIIYTDLEMNYTFPTEVKQFPYRYVFEELEYDGSKTTDHYVVVAPTTDNVEITAHYTKQWWITLTTTQLVIILVGSISLILILLAVTRGGVKAFAERRRYWIRG